MDEATKNHPYWKSDTFKRWWDSYHWDALAKVNCWSFSDKDEKGEGKEWTLQDYWRSEEDHLVEFGGHKWTRVHSPPFDPDGNQNPEYEKTSSTVLGLLLEKVPKTELPGAEVLRQREENYQFPKSQQLDFRGVIFPPGFGLDQSHIVSGDFSEAVFLGPVYFGGVKFFNACFAECSFLQYASFARCEVLDTAVFSGAYFYGGAFFFRFKVMKWADFGGCDFHNYVDFERANFCKQARFVDAVFRSNADFNNAEFEENSSFAEATFEDAVNFSDARFHAFAIFQGVTFQKAVTFQAPRRPEFVFGNYVNFGNAIFFDEACFNGRSFSETTNFKGARFHGLALFHGASLHPETIFEKDCFLKFRADRKTAEAWFAHERQMLENQVKRDKLETKGVRDRLSIRNLRNRIARGKARRGLFWQQLTYRSGLPFWLRWPHMQPLRRHLASETRRYELAFRSLRQLFAEHQDIEDEMLFHGLEMDARRARADIPFVFEGLIALLYKVSSNYGKNMAWPVWWFFAVGLASAGVLRNFVPAQGGGIRQTFFDAYDRVLQHQLPFIQMWSNDKPGWEKVLEHAQPAAMSALYVILALISIGLFAVFLIALRRRFQIER